VLQRRRRNAVDPAALYGDLPSARTRPAVRLNMIASIDGATAVAGVSGGLGGPADQALFAVLRSQADVVLVAAGTVRAEHYGPLDVPVAVARDTPTLAASLPIVQLRPGSACSAAIARPVMGSASPRSQDLSAAGGAVASRPAQARADAGRLNHAPGPPARYVR
jgi:hypothetical protein